MAGRLVWSSTSDVIGRKPTYMIYLGVGAVLYLGVATLGRSSLLLFVLMSVVILSFYGGGFSTVPAYLKDLFGGLRLAGRPALPRARCRTRRPRDRRSFLMSDQTHTPTARREGADAAESAPPPSSCGSWSRRGCSTAWARRSPA